MSSKEAGGELPIEVSLRFPSTLRSGGVRPCRGVEGLPDDIVPLQLIQQLEHEVSRPSGHIRESSVSISSVGVRAYLTRTFFVGFPSVVAWLPSVGVGECSLFLFVLFAGAFFACVFFTSFTDPVACPVVLVAFVRGIAVARVRSSVRGRYVLFIYFTYFLNKGSQWVGIKSESGEFRVKS